VSYWLLDTKPCHVIKVKLDRHCAFGLGFGEEMFQSDMKIIIRLNGCSPGFATAADK
jgi:hypothetical protein